MSYFLFVDESGQDQKESPYEVLAGVAIEDRDLWNLIAALHAAEEQQFGGRYSQGIRELKGANLLTRKSFRLAAQSPPIPQPERSRLARACLDSGALATREQLTALGQAKLGFVNEVLVVASRYRCKCFASITDQTAPRPTANYLRKDYATFSRGSSIFSRTRAATPPELSFSMNSKKPQATFYLIRCTGIFGIQRRAGIDLRSSSRNHSLFTVN